MRSKSLLSAAIALAGICSFHTPVARAAGAKNKAPAASKAEKSDKKKAAELHADERSMKKQLQWEDKVMGPDDKKADLERIARAHEMNEKAEREKERQAALEPAPAPAPAKGAAKKSEVALPSAPEEKAVAPREVSPKLATEEAKAAPPPVKPADDKFIDKLLKEEHPSSKKHASASDRELENLLAGAKGDKPAGRRGKGDSVDDLLKSADKGPAMPAPRQQSGGLPDWAKTPEIAPATPPPAAVAKTPAKKDDGVIQVVQGAASFAPPPPPPPPVATREPAPRKGSRAAAKAAEWNDPFADKKPAGQREFTPAASVSKPAPRPAAKASASASADWNDPFADMQEVRRAPRKQAPPPPPAPAASAPTKRTEKAEPPARPAGWKDPFTKAPAEPSRAPLAMRELNKNESSKWELAAHRAPARPAAAATDAHPTTGWSILKKRAR
jgi:hypothetical protein